MSGKYASGTTVDPSKSRAEIENTLRRYGATSFTTATCGAPERHGPHTVTIGATSLACAGNDPCVGGHAFEDRVCVRCGIPWSHRFERSSR